MRGFSRSLFHPSVANDHDLGPLVAAGLEAFRLHPPRRYRGLRCRGAAFAAAVRVIDRVHGHAAHRRTHAAPALAAGLADRLEVVLRVAGFADGGAAVDVHLADLSRAQAQLRVGAFARQDLYVRARRARELGALAGQHLDAVHDRPDRDVAQGKRVARLDRRFRPRHELAARLYTLRRDDVAALAVGIQEQRDMRAAVRVVLQPLDGGGHRVLVATPIDDAQVVLVPAALVTHGHAAVVVTPAAPDLGLGQRPVRVALVQIRGDDLDQGAAPGRSWFDLD